MLSKREYLSGELKVSKKYQRVLEHRIKEKLKKFYMLELPLTQRLGVMEFSNNITEFSNTVKEKTIETEQKEKLVHKIKPRARFDLAT